MTSNLEKCDELVHCSVELSCAKTTVKESHKFEIAGLKKKKKKKKKKTYKLAYKLAVLEILRNLLVLAYITCPRYPYI